MSVAAKKVVPALEQNLRQGYRDLSAQVEKLSAELNRLRLRFVADTGRDCATCKQPILGEAFVGIDNPSREPLCRACYLDEEYEDLRKRVVKKEQAG